MKPWQGAAAGVAAYLLFMVLTAPAAKVVPFLQPDGVRLAGLEGSLLSGSAALALLSPVQLEDLHWKLRLLPLLLGRAEVDLNAQLLGRPLSARAGDSLFGGPYLADVDATVSATDLLRWLRVNEVAAHGNLALALGRVQWGEGRLPVLSGTASWSPARLSAPVELMLGSVSLTALAQDGVTEGKLGSSGGALVVEGDVQLEPNGAYRIDARIQPKGDVPQAVGQFLSTFAEYNDGIYRLEWSDTLPAR